MSWRFENDRFIAASAAVDEVVIPYAGSPARGCRGEGATVVPDPAITFCERDGVGVRVGGNDKSQPLEVKYV